MALGDPYVTAAELKDYLNIDTSLTQYDTRLADACASASREIEQFTGRQFNQATVATARRFEADLMHTVTVDDFWTTSGLIVERGNNEIGWETLAASDYELYPLDGVVDSVPGWPFYQIDVPYRLLRYPYPRTTIYRLRPIQVRVTAQWGWAAVPPAVKQAALQLAAETYKLAEAPFGVMGAEQFGGSSDRLIVRIRDLPQVARKLNRYLTVPIMIG